MVNYKIRYAEFKNAPKPNIQVFLTFPEDSYELLNDFINMGGSVPVERNHSLQSIEKVLSGQEKQLMSGTERVMLNITKDETLFTDNFDGVYDNIDILPPLKVPTTDLRDLIIWWIQEKTRLEKIANASGFTADELNEKSNISTTENPQEDDNN
ncbi:hypothetical protein A5821_002730 [Enterococcus sp. 7F3_DIV0205]|uniref:Uncharacterized protein n=1 Tax=Candidatus Enterococcus palustris TaxID=1834189 RepID=A0AAQ3WAH1_9ENTE|nr:hypothetical protein [Enterococcus sp. 7F3_DIV0205]OTN83164.1 hypothetical protein A5821_003087 [Enterococcus sp. 7F3_DIV0205]